ncbi:dihydrolipoyl dehydrogenase family protein [Paraburkholderia unamae]|uniref:Pyruvate/2-oxoglutarate dehydrogenase complex dihydrolipoamide dehydrogenase (E3) component n=1 Tax=Paraburkholderia unamae TaxID=219649 RepID=A0ABX5KQ87_9BURK|nr:FAD-dependent oxidoreductase [Paraburkholderia unamae]PVX83649.1 pyruvate/2-oxoglutarate dehydrogenase complex dihydrolipoamide dehydrogenase (E3) component [Paraburkholderia unamae]RAR63796.1 pyruvate/2-oxoglutarate dehydrogenase complex dihydrolipoamide dehydrogenase (E3) component [Paraburkholderia unamae]
MPDIKHFEYLFLGGGKGGKSLAMDLARKGRRVALIERGMIGGSCINVACIPSKTLIQNARNMQVWRTMSAEPDLRVDMTKVHANVRAVVDGMVGINRRSFEQSGLELVLGTGRFVAPRRILVRLNDGTEQLFSGDQVYINTGTVAVIPDIPGLRGSRPMTHIEALNLESLPEHLIVLGGGYIGLEMAQAFRRLGSQVTLVHNMPRVAMREDEDVSREIQSAFEEDGIRLSLATTITRVDGISGEKVTIEFDDGGSIEGSHLLVAAGRQPVTNDLGLDLAGVDLDERGYIKVDDRLATTAKNTWAIGEVAGSPMFTHASFDDYRVLKARIEGRSSSTASRVVPYALFTEPELGRVGINESDAKALGITVRVARLPMMAVPRARTNGTTRGFMKALVAPDSGRILGFTMVGSGAGEVTSVVQMAMLGGLPYTAIRDAIIAHPLLAEGLNLLFATLD